MLQSSFFSGIDRRLGPARLPSLEYCHHRRSHNFRVDANERIEIELLVTKCHIHLIKAMPTPRITSYSTKKTPTLTVTVPSQEGDGESSKVLLLQLSRLKQTTCRARPDCVASRSPAPVLTVANRPRYGYLYLPGDGYCCLREPTAAYGSLRLPNLAIMYLVAHYA
jgi:hypothetical protein